MNVVVAAHDAEVRAELRSRLAAAGVIPSGEADDAGALSDRLAGLDHAVVVTGARWADVASLLGCALRLGRPVAALLTDASLGATHPAFRRGAMAVLPWGTGPRPLLAALGAVSEGLRVIAPPAGGALAEGRVVERALSGREREVLELVAAGLPTKRIAWRLGLSPNTVKHHVAAIFRKLDVRTRTEAYGAALRRGELSV
jgi:two-component system nitrate/nitrite response regulator NarL